MRATEMPLEEKLLLLPSNVSSYYRAKIALMRRFDIGMDLLFPEDMLAYEGVIYNAYYSRMTFNRNDIEKRNMRITDEYTYIKTNMKNYTSDIELIYDYLTNHTSKNFVNYPLLMLMTIFSTKAISDHVMYYYINHNKPLSI